MTQSYLIYQQIKQNIDSNLTQHQNHYRKYSHLQTKEKCKENQNKQYSRQSNNKENFKQINNKENFKQIKNQHYINNHKNLHNNNKKCLAYIVDSQQQQSKLQISEINQRQQQQQQKQQKQIWYHCPIHKLDIINYHFCVDCCSYKLCTSCITSNQHQKHTILTFEAQRQTKSFTKQFLIQKVEESLIRLKSQQNQIKNRASQIDLILKKVHEIQTQLISQIQQTFSSIQKQIRQIYQIQEQKYISSIQQFYKNFNRQSDDLRQNLLSIIQQNFTIKDFQPQLIDKVPPSIPSVEIDKFKAALQKTKRFNRIMLQSLNNLKQKGKQFFNQNQNLKLNQNLKTNKSATQKYQKFLTQNCYANQNQNKSSLLKILDTFNAY